MEPFHQAFSATDSAVDPQKSQADQQTGRVRLRDQLLSILRVPRLGGRHARLRPRSLKHWAAVLLLGGMSLLPGCSLTQKKVACELEYPVEGDGEPSYRGHSGSIDYPCLDNETAREVQVSLEPRNLHRRTEDEVRQIALNEVIYAALSHNQIIESSALGGIGTKAVLTNPTQVASVYDPAIQETGVLFGRRGLDAALSDFDTRFNSTLTWGRDENRLNSAGGFGLASETGNFTSSLSKSFATGGSVSVFNNWNYLGSNAAGNLFPSSYSGAIGTSLRQPLLAGGGVEFTRVAGPVNPAFGSIAGVSQGVVIARINQDVTLADFEQTVQRAISDIENTYWDLYLAYRTYDTAVAAHQSAFQTWREIRTRYETGFLTEADELQALDRLYETKASVETSLNQIYRAESELRRLAGMPMNDGTVLRPADEPSLKEFRPDWKDCLVDGLTYRVELRRQKWQIKSLQLQLNAARNLVQPRLDAVGSYSVNGFGDRLIGQTVTDPGTGLPIHTGLGSLTNDDNNSWTMGFEMSMPVGFRQARSQVRNYELQLAKANAVLASQERNIAHDIATAIQDITVSYETTQTNLKRLKAARTRVPRVQAGLGQTTTLDLVLRAQASAAAAENAYYQQLVQYNKAIASLQLATGQMLQYHNVSLAEGPWDAEALCDAELRAEARRNAFHNPNLQTEPAEFVSPGPAGGVELQVPVEDLSPEPVPVESTETAPPVPTETPIESAGMDLTPLNPDLVSGLSR
ncbi:MAG: TolC family protein [Planctomycetaceae bacterium]|nr:TolC family protein [Planctomycetaceae bacterium]